MYFWKTKALIKDLREGKVSEREKMKYLLATSLVYTVAHSIPLEEVYFASYLDGISLAVSVFMAALGILVCYRANKDGQAFVERFICISWPVTAKLTAACLLVWILAMITASFMFPMDWPSDDSFQKITTWQIMAITLLEILFYWRVRANLLKISVPS